MDTASISSVAVAGMTRLNLIRSLKDEAVEGLRILRYTLWFGLHCRLLHTEEGTDHIKGVCIMYLNIPATSDHLTFHCDSSFLKINAAYLQISENDDLLTARESVIDGKLVEFQDKEWWKVPETSIIYGCGPDQTTCLLLLPNLQYLESRTRNASSSSSTVGRDRTMDWDECSTTESLDNVAPSCGYTLAVLFYFVARLNSGPEGLYLAQDCGNEESEERSSVVLATALEQLFARRVFPCLDIAQHKAPFLVRVVIAPPCDEHVGAEVFSTTRIEQRGTTQVEECDLLLRYLLPEVTVASMCEVVMFEETVSLPPYSASLFYGVFEVCNVDVSGEQGGREALLQCALPVTVNGSSRLSQSYLAHAWASKVFTFVSSRIFHDIRFKIDKVTLMPLRSQRGLGLENHGCITFKEDFFLIPFPSEVPILRVIRIYRLVCHEICHQWIGNLFTPHEITDIWLKEGFVRFIEFLIVDALLESTEARDLLWASFLFEVKAEALIVDAYAFTSSSEAAQGNLHSHPVQTERPCVTLASLTRLFDSITYDKTAALLMMWDAALSGIDSARPVHHHPKLFYSTFVPALVGTFLHAEEKETFLFDSDTIWRFADIHREEKRLLYPKAKADADNWLKAGITSTTPITSPCALKTEELLRPWLVKVGFPWVEWELTQGDPQSNDDSWYIFLEQTSHTKDTEAVWTVPLALTVEYTDHNREVTWLPFLLTEKHQMFKVEKRATIKSINVVDGARGFGFFLLTQRNAFILPSLWWQSPCWKLSNLCMGGMILNVHGTSSRRDEPPLGLWSDWKQLEDTTCQDLEKKSIILHLVISRIQQCHKRGPGPDPGVLSRTISRLRTECCYSIKQCGCSEIIHRSWTWLILGGLSCS